MTDLACGARSPPQTIFQDQSTTNTCATEDAQHRSRATTSTRAILADNARLNIVGEHDGHIKIGADERSERYWPVPTSQVDCLEHDTRCRIDLAGSPDPDRLQIAKLSARRA